MTTEVGFEPLPTGGDDPTEGDWVEICDPDTGEARGRGFVVSVDYPNKKMKLCIPVGGMEVGDIITVKGHF